VWKFADNSGVKIGSKKLPAALSSFVKSILGITVLILKYFCRKNGQKLPMLTQNTAILCKKMILSLGFLK
jgi:hypothetical protein